MGLIPPRTADGPYTLEDLVRNAGGGHDEVNVAFLLRDTRTGRTVETSQSATLDSGETTHAQATLDAPPVSHAPDIEAEYQPG